MSQRNPSEVVKELAELCTEMMEYKEDWSKQESRYVNRLYEDIAKVINELEFDEKLVKVLMEELDD